MRASARLTSSFLLGFVPISPVSFIVYLSFPWVWGLGRGAAQSMIKSSTVFNYRPKLGSLYYLRYVNSQSTYIFSILYYIVSTHRSAVLWWMRFLMRQWKSLLVTLCAGSSTSLHIFVFAVACDRIISCSSTDNFLF